MGSSICIKCKYLPNNLSISRDVLLKIGISDTFFPPCLEIEVFLAIFFGATGVFVKQIPALSSSIKS